MRNFSDKSYFKEEAKERVVVEVKKIFYFKNGRNVKNVKILLGRVQERYRKERNHPLC